MRPWRSTAPVQAGRRRAGLRRHAEPGHQPAPGPDPGQESRSAGERDEAARAAWRERVEEIDPRRFGVIDQAGRHLGPVRLYARRRPPKL